MLYFIKNKILTLSVDSDGGCMASLTHNGVERLWQGGEAWKSRDVVIFPVVGHAGDYTVDGKTFSPKSHGVARYSEFALADIGLDYLTLELKSNAVTKQTYPFDFVFTISYKLKKNAVQVTYTVKSNGGKIPFYVGGHPGMKAPGGSAVVEFENVENPLLYPLDGSPAVHIKDMRRIVLNTDFFKTYKTYQLGSLSGGKLCALTNDGYAYTYKSDCPIYAFWRNENGGDYVCVEPWWGINDCTGAPKELSEKPFINFADENGASFTYSLTIDKI